MLGQTGQTVGGAADGTEQVVSGEVKSFNDMKGFGFLTSPMVDGDVYFQKRDVPAHLQGMPLAGMKVDFALHATPDGKYQARKLKFAHVNSAGGAKGCKGCSKGWMPPG